MRQITIDCRGFADRGDLHSAFAQALSFPDHYGSNLDALHDCLTEISQPTRLRLANWQEAETSLGSYARSAKRAILDGALANPQLAVLFD